MDRSDLAVGKIYRGKRRSRVGWSGEYNDREIIWLGGDTVQYDGPTVRWGQRYPHISVEKFLKWAHSEVKERSDE